MLKNPFSKLLNVTPDGKNAYMLMMGHCTTDNICAIPESFSRYARSEGCRVEDDCVVYIFYLGPDSVPLERIVFLPNNMPAMIVAVANGQNSERLNPVAREYIRLMEEVQVALQMGMSRENAALHYWKLHCVRSGCKDLPVWFLHCFEEFRRDVYAVRDMLKEQEMLPKKRKRGWTPKDILSPVIPDPYEEQGLDPHDFY